MQATDNDKALQQRLGERLRLLRTQRRWSQETLAELAYLHRNYIGHVERSDVNIGLKNIHRIATAFSMSLSEFLEGV